MSLKIKEYLAGRIDKTSLQMRFFFPLRGYKNIMFLKQSPLKLVFKTIHSPALRHSSPAMIEGRGRREGKQVTLYSGVSFPDIFQ